MLSQALHAHFALAPEQRASDRKVLRLDAQAAMPAGEDGIQIHNLSRTGMLAETTADVAVGTGIEVEMPGGTRHHAEVVWRDADLFGCRFTRPLPQAALSAALLRAAPLTPVPPGAASTGDNAALERLREHWHFEHEKSATSTPGLPVGLRLWAIIGLGLACWAIPTGAIALLIV